MFLSSYRNTSGSLGEREIPKEIFLNFIQHHVMNLNCCGMQKTKLTMYLNTVFSFIFNINQSIQNVNITTLLLHCPKYVLFRYRFLRGIAYREFTRLIHGYLCLHVATIP